MVIYVPTSLPVMHLGKNKIIWGFMKASSLKYSQVISVRLYGDNVYRIATNPVEKNPHNHVPPDTEEIIVTIITICIQKMNRIE